MLHINHHAIQISTYSHLVLARQWAQNSTFDDLCDRLDAEHIDYVVIN